MQAECRRKLSTKVGQAFAYDERSGNLVQHIGTEPAQSEAHRYLLAANNMLTSVFEDVYDLDFQNFKLWDLVPNKDLQEWLRASEQLLKDGSPLVCIAVCNRAHALIIRAIRVSTKFRRFRNWLAAQNSCSLICHTSLDYLMRRIRVSWRVLHTNSAAGGMRAMREVWRASRRINSTRVLIDFAITVP